MPIEIRSATEADVAVVLELIRDLAEYEKMSHVLTATEERVRETLFGSSPAAEVLLAAWDGATVGFAVFFFDLLHIPRPTRNLPGRHLREGQLPG